LVTEHVLHAAHGAVLVSKSMPQCRYYDELSYAFAGWDCALDAPMRRERYLDSYRALFAANRCGAIGTETVAKDGEQKATGS
jgi:hypothetical protein